MQVPAVKCITNARLLIQLESFGEGGRDYEMLRWLGKILTFF